MRYGGGIDDTAHNKLMLPEAEDPVVRSLESAGPARARTCDDGGAEDTNRRKGSK